MILGSSNRVVYGEYPFPWAKIASLRPQLFNPDSLSIPLSKEQESKPGDFSTLALDYKAFYLVEGRSEIMTASSFLRIVEHKTIWDAQSQQSRRLFPVYEALTAFSDRKCSIPRDRLFAMLEIVDSHLGCCMVPDYEVEMSQIYSTALVACFLSIFSYHSNLVDKVKAYLKTAARLHTIFGIDEDEIRHCRKAVLCGEAYLDTYLGSGIRWCLPIPLSE